MEIPESMWPPLNGVGRYANLKITMKKEDIFTNEFAIQFEEDSNSLLIFTIHQDNCDPPIRLKLDTLTDMGSAAACKWVGETILLLIPEVRKKLFQLEE